MHVNLAVTYLLTAELSETEYFCVHIMAIESVKRSTMTGIIARLKSKYTSVTNYIITELGVSQSEIEFLRSRFLTDNA